MSQTNPLLAAHTLPALDQIKPEHFLPAAEQRITEARVKLAALKANTSAPTFENTVVALAAIFDDIRQIDNMVICFADAQNTKEMLEAKMQVSQAIAAFTKTVYQDLEIGARFKSVSEPTAEEDRTLYKTLAYKFEGNGAFLDVAGQNRLRAIDDRLIALATDFDGHLEGAAKQQSVLFTDPADLAGLPEAAKAALRENAKEAGHAEGWLVIPERLQVDMLLEIAESRNFRQRIFQALANMGTQDPYNTEAIIREMGELRYERATMLGYPNHAEYALARMMPTNVANAQALLEKVGEGAVAKFEDTARKAQAFATSNGGPRTLEPWDLPYWASRYREQAFGFDNNAFCEHLPLEKVVGGFFKTAEKIFGIRFTENAEHPRYHADTTAYDVTDAKTGKLLGILYADLYARPNKSGGAWMLPIQDQAEGKPNVVSMNMNLLKPEKGKPAILNSGDVATLFHEGGHALHGLLGTKTRHPMLQGTGACSSEFVELFSVILEQWPQQKDCLDLFARHHETGAPMPDALLKARIASNAFFAERDILRVIQNSRRDFMFHTMHPSEYQGSAALHQAADFDHPLAGHMSAYPLTRFGHLFSGDEYASGYYGYLWSHALAELGFKAFKENGVFDPETCERLAAMYANGSSADKRRAFEAFTGEPLTPDAMAEALLESIDAHKPPRVNRESTTAQRAR